MQRSRAALMAAAVRLVSERGTTAISVTDLAETANVSRQLVYLQFGDRDTLLVEAAADLVRREVLPQISDGPEVSRALASARHFAAHRSFYRAMLTGSCTFAIARELTTLFSDLQRMAVRTLFGDLDPATAEHLATFFVGGSGAVINDWLINGAEPLDPEDLANSLLGVFSVFAGIYQRQPEVAPLSAAPHQPD